ncbi:MAG: transglutaminase family protein [Coleofasciculaceae cyanobacterium]
MQLELEIYDFNEYLVASDVIDYDNQNIQLLAENLSKTTNNKIDLVKNVYEYVRDNISHSFDINGKVVTCEASNVLKYQEGICYAKSHLLAALLRCLNIPTGFCYQKLILDDADKSLMSLHGLNAIYLESLDKWIRVDARGNKIGVKAEFDLEREFLAYPIRTEYHEIDFPIVYSKPNQNVVADLRKSKTRDDLIGNLPDEL